MREKLEFHNVKVDISYQSGRQSVKKSVKFRTTFEAPCLLRCEIIFVSIVRTVFSVEVVC